MFATLASGYPRPPLAPDAPGDDVVREVVAELEAAGLEILSDAGVRRDDPLGGIASHLEGFEIGDATPYFETGQTYRRPRAIHEPRWDGPIFVREWQTASAATDLPVKQRVIGPYTLGRLADPGPLTRERLTMALADALAHELRALVAAGVPLIQIDEDAAVLIGANDAEQQLFKMAHRRLTNTVRDAHLTLAATGGSLAALPARVLFDAPYRSYLLDVVAHRDNWRVIAEAPGERGVIVGVANAGTDESDDPKFLAWAALYAASLNGRGADRVGLAPNGSLSQRSPDAAREKIEALGTAAIETHQRVADAPDLLDAKALEEQGREQGFLDDAPATAHRP